MTGRPLRSLAERAFRWSAVTTVGRFALQLVAQITLARLLGPDNYGVYGIGMVVLTFAAFLSGNSFSYILMLQKEIDDEDVRFAFTWQVAAGIACAGAMALAAPWIAQFFGDARVEPMVRWMAVACVLGAFTGPATSLLQRDLNFRALGLIQLVSYGIGYLALGVPMALAGWGAQALAAACVVQAAVAMVASYAVRPHPIRPLLRHRFATETLDMGRTVFLTNIVNWLLTNVDRLLIGRVLNAQAVGLYSVAYNLASIPNVLLIGALQPTFLATGARLQNDPRQLAKAWLTMLACIVVFVTPASVVMALLAGDLVQVLYGPAWQDSGWVMAVLFFCVPAWACWGLSTPVLWNTGRKHQEVLLQLPVLLVAAPVWWYFAPQGIRAIAVVSAAVIFVRAAVIVAAGLRALQLRASALLPFVWRGLVLGGLAAVAVEVGRHRRRLAEPSRPDLAVRRRAGDRRGVRAGGRRCRRCWAPRPAPCCRASSRASRRAGRRPLRRPTHDPASRDRLPVLAVPRHAAGGRAHGAAVQPRPDAGLPGPGTVDTVGRRAGAEPDRDVGAALRVGAADPRFARAHRQPLHAGPAAALAGADRQLPAVLADHRADPGPARRASGAHARIRVLAAVRPGGHADDPGRPRAHPAHRPRRRCSCSCWPAWCWCPGTPAWCSTRRTRRACCPASRASAAWPRTR